MREGKTLTPRTPRNAPSVAAQLPPPGMRPIPADQLADLSQLRRETRSDPLARDLKKAAMLEALRFYPVIRYACDQVGVDRSTYFAWCKADPEFAKLAEQAKADGVERLEADVFRRANGTDTERPSDLLSIFTLKAHKPELYRETVDHRVIGKVQHEIVIDLVRPAGPPPEGYLDAELAAGDPAPVGQDAHLAPSPATRRELAQLPAQAADLVDGEP